MQMHVKVDTSGVLHFIWSDKLRPLFDAGAGVITRASHVEPTETGEWGANLSPVGGPTLGPFKERQAALDAEVKWIEENHLGVPQ